jgi:hypothetical protein
MSPISSSDLAGFARNTAQSCDAALRLVEGDARLGLKYILERLTTSGLRMEDVKELQRVGIEIFEGGGGGEHALGKVTNNKSASPLAIAIGNAVAAAPVPERKAVLLGAVLTAHAAEVISQRDPTLVIFAAVCGAAAARSRNFTDGIIAPDGGKGFTHRD